MNYCKSIWNELEKKHPLPRKLRNIINLEFSSFKEILVNENHNDLKKIIENLFLEIFILLRELSIIDF